MAPNKKKSKVSESGDGEGSAHVDEKLVRSISKLKSIQKELKKINVEEANKVFEVSQKYSEIRREIYTRRNEVLLTIEHFWLTVFSSHPAVGEFLNADDLKILKYLVSLDVEERPKLGYSLTFNFSSNPYFENKRLTKTFTFSDEATAVETGATIKWKEGLQDKELEDIRFFMWLSRTQQIPVLAAELDKVAGIIKEVLWPNPLKYIIADMSLDEGGVQNVDEEGGQDDEIEEQVEDEEGGEIDAEVGAQHDVEIEKQEEDEEGVQGDDEGDGQEDVDDDF